jgi:hypothetical protein
VQDAILSRQSGQAHRATQREYSPR